MRQLEWHFEAMPFAALPHMQLLKGQRFWFVDVFAKPNQITLASATLAKTFYT